MLWDYYRMKACVVLLLWDEKVCMWDIIFG